MFRRRIAASTAAGAALLSAVTACGGGGGSYSTGTPAGTATLAIGLETSIPSLDPAASPVSTTLAYAYDPLIYWAANGSYVPDLATSWGYVGSGNRAFRLTLRAGVKFADGTPLTAQAVTNSIDYFLKTPNPNLAAAGPVKDVRAVGGDTVEIDYSSPYPDAAESLTQYFGVGMIIGPKGIADPAGLQTASDGVGQYNFDSAATRTGSVYTFQASKTYFNQSAVKYKTVQLRIIPSASSRLSALRSGQIQDATQIPLDQVGASGTSGYQRLAGNTTWELMQFLRTSSGPLSSLAVRQAIEYAIDRSAIVKDFYDGYAVTQDQFSPAGTVGYTAALDRQYTYDTARARQLLSQAGYAKGFTFRLLDDSIIDPGSLLGQELKTELAAVGVNVQLTVESGSFAQFQSDLTSGKYDGVIWNMTSIDLYSTATQTIVSPHSLLNPAPSADPTAMSLLSQAASANSAANLAAALQRLNAYLTRAALGVPIATRTNIDLVASGVKLPAASYVTPQADMIGPTPGYAVSG